MSEADEQQIAEAMIRIYGCRAEAVAEDHATSFANSGNTAGYKKWWRVKEIVSGLDPKPPRKKSH